MKKIIALITVIFLFPNVIGEISINNFEIEQEPPGREYIYHKYEDMTYELQNLENDYPNVMKLTSIGQSVLRKELWNVQITNFENQTNIKNRTKIYLDGAHHGDEPLASETCLLFVHYLVENFGSDSYVTDILNKANIFITPMINPDGIDQDTRYNARGIDLNRNYPYAWTPSSSHGTHPASEPEVASNIKFMEKHDFSLYITAHTGVVCLIYPWGYGYDLAPDLALYKKIEKEVEEKFNIEAGQASKELYNATGTAMDYGYGERLTPSFTFEVDNQQFMPGSTTPVKERLQLIFEVSLYLIDEAVKGKYQSNLSVSNVNIPKVEENHNFEITYTITNHGYANATNATAILNTINAEILDNKTKIINIGQLNFTNITFKLKSRDKEILKFELIIYYQKLEIENSTNITLGNFTSKEIEVSKEFGFILPIIIIIAVVFCIFFYIFKKTITP